MDEELKQKIKDGIDRLEPREGAGTRMLSNIRQKAAETERTHTRTQHWNWTGFLRFAVPAAVCLAAAAVIIPWGKAPSMAEEQTAALAGNEEEMDTNPMEDDGMTAGGTNVGVDAENGPIGTMGMQLVNPFVAVESAEVFETELGIHLDAPKGASNVEYSIMDGRMANVHFEAGEHAYVLRAADGTEDIAGLYGEEVKTVTVEDDNKAVLTVIESGSDRFVRVIWFEGDRQFALTNTDGASEEEVLAVYRPLP